MYGNNSKFWDYPAKQTVKMQIRLLLKEQSDLGLLCFPFCQPCLDTINQIYTRIIIIKKLVALSQYLEEFTYIHFMTHR